MCHLVEADLSWCNPGWTPFIFTHRHEDTVYAKVLMGANLVFSLCIYGFHNFVWLLYLLPLKRFPSILVWVCQITRCYRYFTTCVHYSHATGFFWALGCTLEMGLFVFGGGFVLPSNHSGAHNRLSIPGRKREDKPPCQADEWISDHELWRD